MTRSLIMAILAFSLLVLTNLAIFSYLSFRDLSEKMVTEKLMEGLNEASSMIGQAALDDPRQFSEQLAPRLKKFSFFQAIVVMDRTGRVIHRKVIRGGVIASLRPEGEMAGTPERRSVAHDGPAVRMIPVQSPTDDAPQDTRLALEFDGETIRQEVEALRHDLNTRLSIAIGISLVLLLAGFLYVFWAYRRNQALQEAARQADRMAYVGTLSSGLAHEIRNPLNSMNMNVQLVQEELEERGLDENSDIYSMLEGTRKEIRRLEGLVSSFLAYARPTRLNTAPCLVNTLVTDTLDLLEPEIEKNEIHLETELDPSLPELQLDEEQMKQALINVIQNSVQVLQPKQNLTVATRRAGGDKVLIAIKDEGPGISAEELKSIFKVFYSTKRGGTGLGLPIAHRIAELHRGGIKVESEVGKGSTFTFILPMESAA